MRALGFGLLWLILVPFSHAAEHGVVVLQYHHVGDDTPRVTSVTAAELEQHFAYLKEHDYKVVSLTEAKELLAQEQVPDKLVSITFDDGWRNVYDNGLEIFKKYRYPFTIFVNPYLMEQTPRIYMSWEQLRELTEYGATIANHSQFHEHMTWRDIGQDEAAWQQRQLTAIVDAQRVIDDELGSPQPRLFAYPYGEYDAKLAKLLAEQDFLAFGQHSGPWGRYTKATEIPRFPASANYANLDTLKTKIGSLPLPVTAHEPAEMEVASDVEEVNVRLHIAASDDVQLQRMNCFYQGDVIQPNVDDEGIELTLSQPPIGRSRVNCTLPSRSLSGRFYWYSVPLVRPNEQGRWPD
jgi:peptidoglycan/xylan/chitin deacetylase (PgdA/CDA1 family)